LSAVKKIEGARRARPDPAFLDELRRRGDVEGQNLIIERYSGEGRPEGIAELVREVVDRKPELSSSASSQKPRKIDPMPSWCTAERTLLRIIS
jgi:hypothetical protein